MLRAVKNQRIAIPIKLLISPLKFEDDQINPINPMICIKYFAYGFESVLITGKYYPLILFLSHHDY